jgi:hypothetical protein
MKKTLLSLLLIFLFSSSQAQSFKSILIKLRTIKLPEFEPKTIYFNTGKNFTRFSYNDGDRNRFPITLSGRGSSFEIGVKGETKYKYLFYSVGLTYNEFNALAATSEGRYAWNTSYLGIQNTVDYRLFESYSLLVTARGGLNLMTILYGKQEIDNAVVSLKKNREFGGLVFQPSLGFHAQYSLSKAAFIQMGINFSSSFKLNNLNSERIHFNTTQISMGGTFDLAKNKFL